MPKKPKDPCKANACKIQACLSENDYQESKCLEVLEQMRICCLKWHKESLCCSGIKLERSYLVANTDAAAGADKALGKAKQ